MCQINCWWRLQEIYAEGGVSNNLEQDRAVLSHNCSCHYTWNKALFSDPLFLHLAFEKIQLVANYTKPQSSSSFFFNLNTNLNLDLREAERNPLGLHKYHSSHSPGCFFHLPMLLPSLKSFRWSPSSVQKPTGTPCTSFGVRKRARCGEHHLNKMSGSERRVKLPKLPRGHSVEVFQQQNKRGWQGVRVDSLFS